MNEVDSGSSSASLYRFVPEYVFCTDFQGSEEVVESRPSQTQGYRFNTQSKLLEKDLMILKTLLFKLDGSR